MNPIYKWLILSVAAYVSSLIIPGIVIEPIWISLVVGISLAFVSIVVKPVISLITLPINIVTLGLFSLLLNGFIYWILGQVIAGFTVPTFKDAFFGAIIVSIVTWILAKIFRD